MPPGRDGRADETTMTRFRENWTDCTDADSAAEATGCRRTKLQLAAVAIAPAM